MKKEPLVSVIMPAYNSAKFIEESITSVKDQTYSHWELLIIDDASQDSTLKIIRDHAVGDERIRIHPLPTNQGAGFARNIGIKASRGDYISFLDADDLWYPEKLEVQLEFMRAADVQVCYSSYTLMDEAGSETGWRVKALPHLSFNKLLKANYIGNLTGMYCAANLGKVYCPLIRKRQDWGLWLLATRKAGGARGIEQSLARYRIRKRSISGDKWEMVGYNYRVFRKVLHFSVVKSLYRMVIFLWEQFFVKSRQKTLK